MIEQTHSLELMLHRLHETRCRSYGRAIVNVNVLALQALLQKLWLLRPAKHRLVILDSLSGIVKPRRLTLLLGPPSGGKSTLLKALAGQLHSTGLSVGLVSLKLAT